MVLFQSHQPLCGRDSVETWSSFLENSIIFPTSYPQGCAGRSEGAVQWEDTRNERGGAAHLISGSQAPCPSALPGRL